MYQKEKKHDKVKDGQKEDLSQYRESEYFSAPPKPTKAKMWPKFLGVAALFSLFAGGFFFKSLNPDFLNRAPASVGSKHAKEISLTKAEVNEALTAEVIQKLKNKEPVEMFSETSPELLAKLLNGNAKIYAVKVFDTAAEDGDVVELSINDYKLSTVYLSHLGNTVYVPLEMNQGQDFKITAIKDGRGGVTMGAQTSQGQAVTRVMSPGEQEVFKINFK